MKLPQRLQDAKKVEDRTQSLRTVCGKGRSRYEPHLTDQLLGTPKPGDHQRASSMSFTVIPLRL